MGKAPQIGQEVGKEFERPEPAEDFGFRFDPFSRRRWQLAKAGKVFQQRNDIGQQ